MDFPPAFVDSLAHNSSEALLLLAAVGAVAGILRWKQALRRDFLLAFIIFLLGSALREVPVYYGGMTGWGPSLVLVSGIARLIQDVGAALFIRASLKGHCGEWGWLSVVAVVLFFTVLI